MSGFVGLAVKLCYELQLFHIVATRKRFMELCFSPLVFPASVQNVQKKFALWFMLNKFNSASRYDCAISQLKYLFLTVYF